MESYFGKGEMIKYGLHPNSKVIRDDGSQVKLGEVIHAYNLHVVLGYKLPEKLYEKVQKIGPEVKATGIMARTVREYVSSELSKESRKERAWETEEQVFRVKEDKKTESKCYSCGKPGHFAREYRNKRVKSTISQKNRVSSAQYSYRNISSLLVPPCI